MQTIFTFTALALKGIDYEYAAVHLVKDGGEQHSAEYRALNPIGQVPSLALVDNGAVLTQSVAILEYLEEEFKDKIALLPEDLRLRAKVRK